MSNTAQPSTQSSKPDSTALKVLFALSAAHFLNDTLQALIPSIYPDLRDNLNLSYTQIGLITLVYQITASIFQPLVGAYADKYPKPYALATAMSSTTAGLILLSQAATMPLLLISVALIGLGSSVFHPEASRVARMASGGRHGFAQSIFQVGGNFGTSIGPLLAIAVIGSRSHQNVLYFALLGLAGILLTQRVGRWYRKNLFQILNKNNPSKLPRHHLSKPRIASAVAILLTLIFSKYVYLASITNYYTFYLIEKFSLTNDQARLLLFAFLFAVAAGTLLGGHIGDLIGRKYVIWASILGAAPFSLALPYLNLPLTILFTVLIGLILASAFSAILVYAQELLPGNIGLVSGLFFGFAFGIAGIAAALIGNLADAHGLATVYKICSYLPLIGLVTILLPNIEPRHRRQPA